MPFERQNLPQTVAEVEAGLASRLSTSTGQESVYQRLRQSSIGVYCEQNGNTLPLDDGKRQTLWPPAGQRGGPGF